MDSEGSEFSVKYDCHYYEAKSRNKNIRSMEVNREKRSIEPSPDAHLSPAPTDVYTSRKLRKWSDLPGETYTLTKIKRPWPTMPKSMSTRLWSRASRQRGGHDCHMNQSSLSGLD